MILAPLDLISALPWRRAVFTTYALSLSFFEAVLLDALVRGGGREALILADVEGVHMALGEQGARRVGKDYDVEPVAVRAGVFHPKISVLRDIALANQYRIELIKYLLAIAAALFAFTVAYRPSLMRVEAATMTPISSGIAPRSAANVGSTGLRAI